MGGARERGGAQVAEGGRPPSTKKKASDIYQDVVDLRAFYHSPLGRVAARLIRRQIRDLWPDVRGMDVLGLGYATPYLNGFSATAAHNIAVMPAAQGVIRWPRYKGTNGPYGGNRAALARETELPLKDASFDRILMVHILEHSEQSRHLLREIWRTLSPGGRVIVVVPSRMGPWCRTDRTPFGHGQPFSTNQIKNMLSDNMLTPTRWTSALNLPPFQSAGGLAMLGALESVGQKWWRNFAGVLIIEAEKQIYAGGGKRQTQTVTKPAIAGNNMRRGA